MRRVPDSGVNLFQLVYVLLRDYSGKTGLEPLNLSLGNPDGVPPEGVRKLQARFAEDPGYAYHTYAEEKDLEGFAEGMVELHSGVRVSDHPRLRAAPIPGIKTASCIVPLACGLHLSGRDRFAVASNLPAYDIIGTWSERYLGAKRIAWPLLPEENMRINPARLEGGADLVFVIRPGNPAAVGASAGEWRALIERCLERGTRLVNDAAYAGLADARHATLASVAKDYPELEWLELYSVSKSFSDPGARLGALVGSREFVEDFLLIKGNTESGPVPSVMAAYGRYFRDRGAARAAMEEIRGLYARRLAYLTPKLRSAGLKPACETDAGFFTLWKAPSRVLGRDLRREAPGMPLHEAFNRTVIRETGIAGVHFEGFSADGTPEPLVRYAACADVLDPGFQARFEEALERLKPEYGRE